MYKNDLEFLISLHVLQLITGLCLHTYLRDCSLSKVLVIKPYDQSSALKPIDGKRELIPSHPVVSTCTQWHMCTLP